jgi:hypothetical protein
LNFWRVIPDDDVSLDIITKCVFKEHKNIDFGTYRVMIAVGGIEEQKYGSIDPKYFFATLYYDRDCALTTLDFHQEMR